MAKVMATHATGETMTLREFLLARFVEDEELTNERGFDAWYEGGWGDQHADQYLREIEAKRRIVAWCSDEAATEWNEGPVLHMLAAVYADHPDYNEGWCS